MADFDYDLFTIGAGSGGVRASRLASLSGAKVAIAEEYRVGGTCVIRGCVPKKFMVYASEYGRAFKEAKGYGWSYDGLVYDHARFNAAMSAEIDRLSGIYARNLKNAGVEIVHERAEIAGPNAVRLVTSGKTVTARRILVATGGRPWRPLDLEGQELAITSDEVFHIETLPRHIVIAGGGYIAVEFAHIFAGLGVETCLVYRGETVLRGFDDDVRTQVHEGLKRAGVRVITQTVFSKLSRAEDGCIRVDLDNGMHLMSDVVMLAIGREPATHGLGCERAGVTLGEKGEIKVDEYSRTTCDSIWAIGDVTDRVALTPVAIREGQCFAQTEFMDEPSLFDYDDIPTAVFTQPPVGTVGLSEADARKRYGKLDIYKASFRPMKAMLSGDEGRVLMKLVVKADDQRVVGCHIVGPDSPEIIQAVGIAVKMGATKQDFDRTCALHPSLAEELVTMREKWRPNTMG
jgi:glutathione reductase (NADPH)